MADAVKPVMNIADVPLRGIGHEESCRPKFLAGAWPSPGGSGAKEQA